MNWWLFDFSRVGFLFMYWKSVTVAQNYCWFFTVFSRSTKNRLLSIVFDMCLHTFDTKQQKSKQYIFSRWFLILVAGIQHAVWATVNAIIHRRYNRLLAFRKTFLLFLLMSFCSLCWKWCVRLDMGICMDTYKSI